MIDFNGVKLLDHPSVVQILVNLILTYGMLNIVVLDLLRPRIVKVVNLASDFPTIFKIVSFVHLGIPAFAQNAQDKVPIFQHGKLILGMDAAVL